MKINISEKMHFMKYTFHYWLWKNKIDANEKVGLDFVQ